MAEYTTKINQAKLDAVESIKERFSQSKNFIFADYRGLRVDQITELRNQLREREAEFKVVKNRHAKIAFAQLELPDVSEYLVGPTALTFVGADSAAAAKVLFDYGKDTPVAVKGAIIDGRVFDASQTEAISKLPSMDELIAKLMGTMNAPLTHLMYAMNGVASKLVRTLQAVAEKKQAEGK